MSNTIADVLRLFIAKASFLAGSKRRQVGIDKTLKQILIHNDTDDTLVDEWSGDSLQVLKAGAQTITGDKTFSGITTHTNEVDINAGNILKLKDVGNATTGHIHNSGNKINIENVDVIELDSSLAGNLLLNADATLDGEVVDINSTVGAISLDGTTTIDLTATTTLGLNGDGINIIAGAGSLALNSGDFITSTTTNDVDIASNAGNIGLVASAGNINLTATAGDISLLATDDLVLQGLDSVAVNLNKNATAEVTITNRDDTNASVLNNAALVFQLTDDISAGGVSAEAFTITVEKNVAWSGGSQEVKTSLGDFIIDQRIGPTVDILDINEDNINLKYTYSYGELKLGNEQDVDVIVLDGAGDVKIANTTPNYLTANSFFALTRAGTVDDAPFTLPAGDLTTAPFIEAGDIEFNGKAFYATPSVDNRGVIPVRHCRIFLTSANYTFATTLAQPWFPTLGTLTLPGSTTYRFKGILRLSTPATGHNTQLSFGGTATLTSIAYTAKTWRGAASTIGSGFNVIKIAVATAVTIDSGASATAGTTIDVEGILRTNVEGTLIPQWATTVNLASGQCEANSFFELEPIGSDAVMSVGNWS